jgi:DNA (cytosine-5)-methyltransferase 1
MTADRGVYYNENDPFAAQWLRNLVTAGHIAPGDVDDRSIEDVTPEDLDGYAQCHFFAGVGGWSYAARLAGWPDDRALWTGSPPCQDHSVAGAVWGVRHGIEGGRGRLVRSWLALVERWRPRALAFENVPGIRGGALAEVKGRLAGAGYRMAEPKRSSADLGAPHLRRRVWVVAHRDGAGQQEPRPTRPRPTVSDPRRTAPGDVWSAAPGRAVGMADGFPARVAAIRAFGNAIDPWVGAAILGDLMEMSNADR